MDIQENETLFQMTSSKAIIFANKESNIAVDNVMYLDLNSFYAFLFKTYDAPTSKGYFTTVHEIDYTNLSKQCFYKVQVDETNLPFFYYSYRGFNKRTLNKKAIWWLSIWDI